MKILRVLLAAAALPYACLAESPPTLAHQVLDAARTREMLHEGFRLTLKPSLDAMKAQGAPDAMIAELRQASEEFFLEHFNWIEVQTALARLYEQQFTPEELADLLKFYQSPTGKKAAQVLPSLTQQGALPAMQRLQQYMPQFQAKIQEIMSRHASTTKSAP